MKKITTSKHLLVLKTFLKFFVLILSGDLNRAEDLTQDSGLVWTDWSQETGMIADR